MVQGLNPNTRRGPYKPLAWDNSACQSHADHEAQTLVKRIEKNQASQEAETENARRLREKSRQLSLPVHLVYSTLGSTLGLGQLTLVAPTPRPRQPSARTAPLAAPVAETAKDKSLEPHRFRRTSQKR